jgi:small subunit ribosomal protein S17e
VLSSTNRKNLLTKNITNDFRGCRDASDSLLNKIRKVAGDLLAKYPTLFSTNFEANKKALDQVAIIRNRALRNQIAGAITSLAAEAAPAKSEEPGVEIGETMGSSSPGMQATSSAAETVEGAHGDQSGEASSAETVSQQA